MPGPNQNTAQSGISPDSFYVKIQTPEAVIWEGAAEAVTSRNSAGLFDILPEHANFITLIDHQPIEVVTLQGSKEFTFQKAVLALQNNRVSIYADVAVPQKT